MTPVKRTFPPLLIWLLAVFLSVAAIGLHLCFLRQAGGFWRDEVNLINLSGRHSLAEMEKDSFPLLMPLLIHSWLGAGFDETSLRWLGLFIGLGIPAAIWFSAWKIVRTPPLLGLVLFGLNSTLIIFGDSMRAYGLGCLLIVLTTFSGCFFLLRPSWKRAGGLAALSVLSVQALYHNAILVGAICLGVALVCLRRRNRPAAAKAAGAGALAAISLLPYLPNWIAGREASSTLRTGLKLSRLLEGFNDSFGFPLAEYTWIWGLLAAVLLFHGWRAFRESRKTPMEFSAATVPSDLTLFAAATLALAFAGFFIFLKLAAFPSQSWYLLPLMAVAATCLDVAWPQWSRQMQMAIIGLAALTVSIAIPTASRFLDYRYTNVDVWARQMKNDVAPEDYVVVVPWYCGITFEHYFKNPAAWDTLPPILDHSIHRFDLVKVQLQNTNALAPVLGKISSTLQAGHRVWVLAEMGWMDVPEPGTTAAAVLPPAPLGKWGWSEVPYTLVWVSQVAHYVGDHSRQFERVKNPTAGERTIENTELFVASGWQDASRPLPGPPVETKQP